MNPPPTPTVETRAFDADRDMDDEEDGDVEELDASMIPVSTSGMKFCCYDLTILTVL